MAVGTPVVAFETGGIPEMVVPESTGLLVEPGDVDGLPRALRGALTGGKLRRWGEAARKRALELYSHEVFFDNHSELYADVIASRHRSRKAS